MFTLTFFFFFIECDFINRSLWPHLERFVVMALRATPIDHGIARGLHRRNHDEYNSVSRKQLRVGKEML